MRERTIKRLHLTPLALILLVFLAPSCKLLASAREAIGFLNIGVLALTPFHARVGVMAESIGAVLALMRMSAIARTAHDAVVVNLIRRFSKKLIVTIRASVALVLARGAIGVVLAAFVLTSVIVAVINF